MWFHVNGSVASQNAHGLVVVGDPAVQCAGTTAGQSITLAGNHHGVASVGNTYGAAFPAVANTGNGFRAGQQRPGDRSHHQG